MKDNEMDLDNLEKVSGGSHIYSNSSERTFNLIDPQRKGYMDQLENIIIQFKNVTSLTAQEEGSLRRQLKRILPVRTKTLTVKITKDPRRGIQVNHSSSPN